MSNKLIESRKILGESPPVKHLISLIHKVAGSKTNILIIGESGTGKELVARMIHESGPMKNEPFIPVNCGAIPETLIESEMFGHKKGSFTGAVSDKEGLFEAADKGTLFLDEVGELPLSMQVKLLRALQERTIRKVGSNTDTKVDVRIIAATNRNLEEMVAKGTFREDLYYRLNVILIKTPPLRDRSTDIELLMNTLFRSSLKNRRKK
jgi:two-component system response regulator PilR (NtrC family)